MGPPSASNFLQNEGTCVRSSRLVFELLELALRELEDHGTELLEPQFRTTVAAFSRRLRVLGEKISAASAEAEACRGPIPAMTQDASGDTLVGVAVEGADAAACRDSSSATVTPTTKRQNIGGTDPLATEESRVSTKELTMFFEQLDSDRSGSVGMTELSISLRRMGLSQAQIRTVMGAADTSGNGLVDRREFLHAASNPEIRRILEQVHWADAKGYACMLRQSSVFRICWDMTISIALSHMAIVEPLFLAFPSFANAKTFEGISMCIDFLFMSDVFLNFRTGFYTADQFEVLEPCEVARHYLKTWFMPDLISAVPFDLLSGGTMTSLHGLRLIKYWRILKCMKAHKLFHTWRGVMESERVMDWLEWFRTSRIGHFVPLCFIMALIVLIAHWLACFMIASGDGFLGEYLDAGRDMQAEYVSGLYWAFMTISTVGYGDITPGSTVERLYTIFAMVVGGACYGYFIASFTSLVTHSDEVKNVYRRKMKDIEIWLQHHQFPLLLQKRTRRYFQRQLKTQAHVDGISLLNSLSPELRREICRHIVLPEVRASPIFAGVPAGVMSRLAKIVQRLDADASETLVRDGEVGSSVYIIVSGEVRKRDRDVPDTSNITSLWSGDSFGEELLLNPTGLYEYSAMAHTNVSLQVLPVAAFLEEFGKYQDVFKQVRFNIESMRKEKGLYNVSSPKPFETQVIDLLQEIRTSRAHVSSRPFETQVLDQLRELQASYKELASRVWNHMLAPPSKTSSLRSDPSDSRLGIAKL